MNKSAELFKQKEIELEHAQEIAKIGSFRLNVSTGEENW